MKRKTSYTTTKTAKRQKPGTGVRKDQLAYRPLRSLHPDFKVTDLFYNNDVNTTPDFQSVLQNLTAGPLGRNQYIGRTISPVGLDIRAEIVGSQTSTFLGADLYNNLRIVVFQWMDDATVTGAGTLQSIADGLAAGFALTSPINFKNYNNIEVLMDENFTTHIQAFNPAAGTYAVSNLHHIRRYIKGRKMREVEFDGAGTGATTKGGINIMLISDSTAAPNPTINITARLTYLDA